jgi:hypothetical protein
MEARMVSLRVIGTTLAAAALATASGCGPSKAAAAATVSVATEAPTGCKSLGAVHASASNAGNDEKNAAAARTALQAQAAELGANVVVVEKERTHGMMAEASGQAFLCPAGS